MSILYFLRRENDKKDLIREIDPKRRRNSSGLKRSNSTINLILPGKNGLSSGQGEEKGPRSRGRQGRTQDLLLVSYLRQSY